MTRTDSARIRVVTRAPARMRAADRDPAYIDAEKLRPILVPGADDYDALRNKPSIEGVTLQGDRTFEQLGLEPMTPQDIDKIIYG